MFRLGLFVNVFGFAFDTAVFVLIGFRIIWFGFLIGFG